MTTPRPPGAGPDDSVPVSSLMRELARPPEAPPEEAPGTEPAPGDRIGRFEILRELGRGGFGVVFEARDTELGRRVALKLMRRDRRREGLGEELLAEVFRREAATVARLNHPSIVTLHDYGLWNGLPYLVLELLRGETLHRRLRGGPLPPPEALEVGIQVARALCHAHAAGVIHRDLKPGNVFLLEDGTAKVLDFGLARLLGALDEPGRLLRAGTPRYMAPEQAAGAPQDERTDIYSAGMILFEMISEGMSEAPPPLQSGVRPSSTEEALAEVIARALWKGPEQRFQSARDLLDALLAAQRLATGPASAREPYHYLEPFSESDAADFFGREREEARLHRMLMSRPVVAVVGPSGAGKTSLVQAGLLPRLRQEGRPWTVLRLRPGSTPLARLGEQLVDCCGNDCGPPLRDQLRERPGLAGEVLRTHVRQSGRQVLLLVDPLEELFTQGIAAEERAAFAAAILAAADAPEGGVRAVLVLRDDFLVRLTAIPELRDAVTANLLLVGPPDAESLAEVVREPARAQGYDLDPGLAEEMVTAVAREAVPLPLLELAASRLWERRDRGRRCLTREALLSVGGVAGVLAAHANEVLQALRAASEMAVARRLLCALVTSDGTRRSLGRKELLERFSDQEEAARVLGHLVRGRLVAASRGLQGDEVELAHESLVTGWEELASWLQKDRGERRRRELLAQAALLWDRDGRSEDVLWTGPRLRAALARAKGYAEPLSESEQAFLSASSRRRRRARRRQLLAAAAATCALAGLGLGAWWLIQEKETATTIPAVALARVERVANVVSAAATSRDPLLSALLLAEIQGEPEPPGGVLAAHAAAAASLPLVVLRGHAGGLTAGAFSPDGRFLATASRDGTGRLWSLATDAPPRVLRGHRGEVLCLAFSKDGSRLATASDDRTVRVWSIKVDRDPLVLRGHEDWVLDLAFSPDGGRLATGSADRTARLWRLDGSAEPDVLRGHKGPVSRVAFSPRGDRLATASQDGTARLWHLGRTSTPVVLSGHAGEVLDVAFSPDGQRLATASADGNARVWDGRGSLTAILRGHREAVRSVAFERRGRRLLTSSADHTARIWPADGRGEPLVLRGHEAPLHGASFGPDGGLALTFGEDGTARLWAANVAGPATAVLRHPGLREAALSPDGTRAATLSSDGTARLWVARPPPEPRVLGKPNPTSSSPVFALETSVWRAAFSPNGRLVATANADGIVRLGPADGSRSPRLLRGHTQEVFDVAFSPDGTRLASVSFDGTARVWPVHDGASPVVLRGHEEKVFTVAFSPDGRRLVTASMDKTVRVWPADGVGRPVVLRGHTGSVYGAAFSPDSQRVVSASADGTARVWRADGATDPVILRGHQGHVYSAGFSPDGSRVVTASKDATARVWPADGRGAPVVLRGHTGTVWRARFSPTGALVVTASPDGTARVWSSGGRGQTVVLRGHAGQVLDASFSPTGDLVVTASYDRTVRVWRADGRGEAVTLRGHAREVSGASFSPDGTRIVSSGHDATARIWSVREPRAPPVVLQSDVVSRHIVTDAALSPDGRLVAAGSHDRQVRLWPVDREGEAVALPHAAEVTRVEFSPDGRFLATAGETGEARLFRLDTLDKVRVLREHAMHIEGIAWSPDSSRLLTVSQDKTGGVWEIGSESPPLVLRGHGESVEGGCFLAGGAYAVTVSWDQTARVWRSDRPDPPLMLRGHTGPIAAVACAPDGVSLATASQDRTARIWRLDRPTAPTVLEGHEGQLTSVAFSPDGGRLVTGAHDRTARVWRTSAPGDSVVLRGHQGTVNSVAFSPDGREVLTASDDHTARVWRADGTGSPLVLRGHLGAVLRARYGPDGQRVVTASSDGTARVWRVGWAALLELLRASTSACLTPEERTRLLGEQPEAARAAAGGCEREQTARR